MTYFALFDRIR